MLEPPGLHVVATKAVHMQLCPLTQADLVERTPYHCLLPTQGISIYKLTGTFQIIRPNPLPSQGRPGAQIHGRLCLGSPGQPAY